MNNLKSRVNRLEDAVGVDEKPDPLWIIFHKPERYEGKEDHTKDNSQWYERTFIEPLTLKDCIRIIPWDTQARRWFVKNWKKVIPEIRELILRLAKKEGRENFLNALEEF